ncbi:hypothetical protein [Streptomyces misionensis]|uniref:hypothetical protein n=1 Tax=Streptomyces misionensis TaxID=67331 RepID=UPI0036C0772A
MGENTVNPAGTTQIIHEVDRRLRKPVTHTDYRRDLAYAHEMGLGVHSWRGEDREGKPMVITWVTTDSGRVLSAYEIQGRA